MQEKKKTYLDLYLDSTIDKKRGIYFTDEHENAIVKFNDPETSDSEKLILYEKYIEVGFRRIISGVLEMSMFHNLGKMNRINLIEDTYNRLIEKMKRFTPGRIGKSGKPVKAYSFFSTIAKHFILEQKIKHEKVVRHKADVESSIDLTILSEDTLQKMSNYNKEEVFLDSTENIFNETKEKINKKIEKLIKIEENKDKPDLDFVKIGYCLKYIINKWDRIQFEKKNEFMRILTSYTGLKQQQVSLIFKKYRLGVLAEINPKLLNKKLKDDIEDDFEINETVKNEVDDTEENDGKKIRYDHVTFEDFEMALDKETNNKFKEKWKKTISKEVKVN